MLIPTTATVIVGDIQVRVTHNRTKTEWEWAQEVADKVIFVADTAPSAIRDQAQAFKAEIMRVVAHNVAAAVLEERAACALLAEQQGAFAAAQAIKERAR